MNFRSLDYCNPIDRNYLQTFYDEVLAELFDGNIVPDFEEMFGKLTSLSDTKNWKCVVATDGNTVAGGVLFEYLSASKCTIIEYCSTRKNYSYILDDLLTCVMDTVNKEFPDTRFTFIELIPEVDEIVGGVFANRCKMIDFDYLTPPVREGSKPVDNLILHVVDSESPVMRKEILLQFLHEYFERSFTVDNVDKYVPVLSGDMDLVGYVV